MCPQDLRVQEASSSGIHSAVAANTVRFLLVEENISYSIGIGRS